MADLISTKIRAKRTRQEETPKQRQERLKNAGSQIDGVENQKLLKNVVLGLTVKGPIVNEGTSKTDDQRAVRLAQLSHNQQQRLSTESDDQRAARLAHLNHNQRQRLSTENDDQRAARPAQLSHNRQERMSLETPEVRQRRLQLDRDGHQQTRQLRIQSQKIEKYHEFVFIYIYKLCCWRRC